MVDIEELNIELKDYFMKRGWSNAPTIIRDNTNGKWENYKKEIYILPNWFYSKFDNWTKNIDKEEFEQYFEWFMEHVKPFWFKYHMGNRLIYFHRDTCMFSGFISIDSIGRILAFAYDPKT